MKIRSRGGSAPMKVLLASPRGFCAGVNMAIESLGLALRAFGPPIYVYHEIVHNRHVVESFRDQGAVFVSDLQEVPPGSDAAVFGTRGFARKCGNWRTSASCGPSMPHVRS